MKNIKKAIAVLMAIMTMLSATPVMAASTGSVANDIAVGEDTVQNAKTAYGEKGVGTSKTDVYLTVDNSGVVVGVPTVVVLNGTPNSSGEYIGDYSVSVSGDMSGTDKLTVEPDSYTVTVQQTGKNDITGTITQEQTEFDYSDLANNTVTTGAVKAVGLTAGSWRGQFNMNINLETVTPPETDVNEFVYGASLAGVKTFNGNREKNYYGLATRIIAPKSDITMIDVITYLSDDADVTCSVLSSDFNTVYATTTKHITTAEHEAIFRFDECDTITDNEVYIALTADEAVFNEGMTTYDMAENQFNTEIGAANAAVAGKGNAYISDKNGEWVNYRQTGTVRKNGYAMQFYVFALEDESKVVNNYLYVSNDGNDETGDGSENHPYATIFKAVDVVTENADNSYYNQYTIKVADGYYDELCYYNKDDYKYNAFPLINYVTYEGNTEHPENCVIYSDGMVRYEGDKSTPTNSCAVFHGLNNNRHAGALSNHSSVKGFTLEGRYLRYTLHIDSAGYGIGENYEFSDLIIKYYNDFSSRYAIGCGEAVNSRVTYRNVKIISNSNPYYAHNNANNQKLTKAEEKQDAEILFENCDFGSGDIVLGANDNENSVNHRLNNCTNVNVVNPNKTLMKVYINGELQQ